MHKGYRHKLRKRTCSNNYTGGSGYGYGGIYINWNIYIYIRKTGKICYKERGAVAWLGNVIKMSYIFKYTLVSTVQNIKTIALIVQI